MDMKTKSSRSLLLDTNIWLDYFLGGREGGFLARKLVVQAESHGVTLLYAAPETKDIFYLLASELKRQARAERGGTLPESEALAAQEAAWSCLESLDKAAAAVGCDISDIWIARKHRSVHQDYEDNLILAAVLRSGANMLVTSDQALLAHAPAAAIACGTCEDALKWLEATQS